MDVKKVALLVGALVIAVITAVMAKNMFAGAGADAGGGRPGGAARAQDPGRPQGAAGRHDHRCRKASPSRPGRRSWSRTPITSKARPTRDIAKLLGTVVRNPITAGQPVTRGALVGPNDRGFLAAALGPGMRAVTVPVSATSGVAGFVFPGDRVDMVLTQEVAGGGDGPPLKVSETIVRNLRVLATDQRIDSKNEEGKTECQDLFDTSRSRRRRASPRRSRSPSRSARCRCRCARSPTIRPSSSGRSPPARSRCPRAPTRPRSAACCSRSPTADRHQHHLHHRRRRLALPAPHRPGQAGVGWRCSASPRVNNLAGAIRRRRWRACLGPGGPRFARQ